jgi:hypothetical protein
MFTGSAQRRCRLTTAHSSHPARHVSVLKESGKLSMKRPSADGIAAGKD